MNYPKRPRDNVSHQRVTNPQNRDVNAATRAATALALRAERLTYDEIAKRAGYSGPSASRKAVLGVMDRVVVKNVEELRTQELHMLDVMHQEVWLLFMDRKNRGRLFAVDRLLAISERRSKLMGLDLSNDNAIAAAQIIVQEVPSRYLTGPAPVAEVEG